MLTLYNLPLDLSRTNPAEKELLIFLSEKRKNRLFKYRLETDRKLCLYGALLVYMGLAETGGISPRQQSFAYGKNGKPYLVSDLNIHFNLSHTKGYILCCISTSSPVGVDVEKIKTAPYEIMNRCFHHQEIEYIKNSPTNTKEQNFFEIWTKKEAYVKRTGSGITEDLTKINTFQFADHYYSYRSEQYMCAVCFSETEKRKDVFVTAEDVANFFLS